MRQLITLNHKQFLGLIKESVTKIINEMATFNQIEYLKKLAGSEWQEEWANDTIPDTSKRIQSYIDRNKRNGATNTQLNKIANNKYFPLPEIMKIKDVITSSDASSIIDALIPYSGKKTHYGSVRDKKEIWLSKLQDIVLPILKKYQLQEEYTRVSNFVQQGFMEIQKKNDKQKERKDKENLVKIYNFPHLTFIKPNTEKTIQGSTEPLPNNFWISRTLQQELGTKSLNLYLPLSFQNFQDIEKYALEHNNRILPYPVIIYGYMQGCWMFVWLENNILQGMIMKYDELTKFESYAQTNLKDLNLMLP